jgi:hypothetical protein
MKSGKNQFQKKFQSEKKQLKEWGSNFIEKET